MLLKHKDYIKKKYGVKIIGIFGSFARGEQTEISDVDILVEVERPIGLEFFGLWDEIEKILGLKVDLLTIRSVKQKPLFWESIKKDIVYV